MRPANYFADTIARILNASPFDLGLDPLAYNLGGNLDECECGVTLTWSHTLKASIPYRDPSDAQITAGEVAALIRCDRGFGGIHTAKLRDIEEFWHG
ncbi:hypothetical protein ACFV1N_25340 [Streptosporangium canum]|uniref:hypothetical protein n=1 Tax=Streptosporangium canum TaxID=324952 RepID=UPI0036738CBE